MWSLGTFRSISKITQLRLLKCLERELRFERSFQSTSGFLNRYLDLHKFSIKSEAGSSILELTKRKDEYEITVRIKARVPDLDMQKQGALQLTDEPKAKDSSDSESDSLMPDSTSFHIVLRRDQEARAVVLDCATKDSILLVNYIAVGIGIGEEREQTHWLNVLRWLGIEGDLAKAVESFSLIKESEEYQNWLQRFHTFISQDSHK